MSLIVVGDIVMRTYQRKDFSCDICVYKVLELISDTHFRGQLLFSSKKQSNPKITAYVSTGKVVRRKVLYDKIEGVETYEDFVRIYPEEFL